MTKILISQPDSEKEVAGKGRPVNVARVAVRSGVEIVLEGVEHVLHSCVQLQRDTPEHLEVICRLEANIPEVTCLYRHIVLQHSRVVLHQHASRVCSSQCKGQVPYRIV